MASSRKTLDLGLLALRTAIGGTLAYHGAQKLFGWFGGPGLEATAQGFEAMGFTPGKESAALAGAGELAGGLLVAGAATPLASAGVVGAMVGAVSVHKPNGFSTQAGGYEYPAVLGATAAALALTGPGRYSVDALLGNRLNRGWQAGLALAGAAATSGYLVSRRAQA
ncbi:DoxX family protein [Tsukamurella sp. 8F]|uniref:DoxX family protein n=1 Tax=unclassified Tsukamurella TaxID=2633480 RepID=UPI0023B8A278|nr:MULTISPECIES: DoxX family protein [unclassified Tsukamurella]MDF0531918.1 DoxX family protein [Tsukamurella sp. 8J]MDF0586942.1 DoxX family protein [Tsukamurella sp. 8F]